MVVLVFVFAGACVLVVFPAGAVGVATGVVVGACVDHHSFVISLLVSFVIAALLIHGVIDAAAFQSVFISASDNAHSLTPFFFISDIFSKVRFAFR